MLRLIAISDLHADTRTMGVSRLPEAERVLMQAVERAIAIRADAFLFGGDLADPDNGGDTLLAQRLATKAAAYLAGAGVLSAWIPGNHDVVEDGTGASVLSSFGELRNMSRSSLGKTWLVEQPDFIHLGDDAAVGCFPFAPLSHHYDPRSAAATMFSRAAERGRKLITLSHLTVRGLEPGEEMTEMPRGRDVYFPFEETKTAVLRLNGHHHRRQTFDPEDGGPPIQIIGSPMRVTAAEEDQTPGFLEIEIS